MWKEERKKKEGGRGLRVGNEKARETNIGRRYLVVVVVVVVVRKWVDRFRFYGGSEGSGRISLGRDLRFEKITGYKVKKVRSTAGGSLSALFRPSIPYRLLRPIKMSQLQLSFSNLFSGQQLAPLRCHMAVRRLALDIAHQLYHHYHHYRNFKNSNKILRCFI